MLRELLRASRPVQWVKNVFVFAPLIFGLRLLDPVSVERAALVFAFFCLVSSAVYLLNDLVDREADARHPTKCRRPIASGRLPVPTARVGMIGALLLGVSLGAALDWRVGVVLLGYFGLNVAYSLELKRHAFIDIACIALGFLLRVVAGGLAISVPVSAWLFVCTFLLASLLALGKRRHELVTVLQNGKTAGTREVLERYRREHIDLVLRMLAIVTVVSYTAYTVSPLTVAHFHTRALVFSVPFVALGLWRFFHLVGAHAEAQSPTDTMVRDVPFLMNIGAYVATVTVIIYYGL